MTDPLRAPTTLLPTIPGGRRRLSPSTAGLLTGAALLLLCCGGITGVAVKFVNPGEDKPSAARAVGEPDPAEQPSPEPSAIDVPVLPVPSTKVSRAATRTASPARPSATRPAGTRPTRTRPAPPPSPPATAAPTVPPAQQGVKQGAFCSPAGALGYTKKGKPMRCGPSAADASNRWRPA